MGHRSQRRVHELRRQGQQLHRSGPLARRLLDGPRQSFPNQQRTRVVLGPHPACRGHTDAGAGVNLISPNTKFQERWNQLDLSAKKTFRFGSKEFQGQFAVFNVTNGNVVLQEVQTFGANLGQPQNFLQGRMMRLALLINF